MFYSFTVFHDKAQKWKFSVIFLMKIDWKVTIFFWYSFPSFHWMTYNFYFHEYCSFCSFGVFWGVCKCYCILSSQCWKWHADSETVLSATLSPKLWLILVISKIFFFMQVEFVTGINKRPLSTKCFTISEVIHGLCLQLAMVPNFVSSTTHGY